MSFDASSASGIGHGGTGIPKRKVHMNVSFSIGLIGILLVILAVYFYKTKLT